MRRLIFLLIAIWSWGLSAQDFSAIQARIQPQNEIGYLSIDQTQPINESTYLYVKFALEEYKKRNVTFVLLHLDTPGGEVFAAMKIAQLLHQTVQQEGIPVIAFIDHWAVSAGAMLAYASPLIAITPSSIMGAAEPVIMGSEGKAETASEKVNSAQRAEFANLAAVYGRNSLIAEAMVDKEMILVRRNGKIVRLESEADMLSSDQMISRPGKLLTLNAKELLEEGIADFMVTPQPLRPLTEAEQKSYTWPAEKNLLFQAPFFADIPHAKIVAFHSWKIRFFSWLSHPLVSSLLLMGLLIGIYAEMSHPGFGLPGLLALLCLSLILLSSFATSAAGSLEFIILGIGVLLLLVELLILPGFGWTGAIGILLILIGLFALTVPSIHSVEFHWDIDQLNAVTLVFIQRLAYFIGALIGSVFVIAGLTRYFTPILLKKSPFVLREDQSGYSAVPVHKDMKDKEGVAATDLKPSGYVLIEGSLFQALAETGFIDKGKTIKVIRGQGAHLVVRREKS